MYTNNFPNILVSCCRVESTDTADEKAKTSKEIPTLEPANSDHNQPLSEPTTEEQIDIQ